jgi:hypothetical protein
MDKKRSSQLGISAIWDGPYESPQSSLKPGSSRQGSTCMKVAQAGVPYKEGPISSLAKG